MDRREEHRKPSGTHPGRDEQRQKRSVEESHFRIEQVGEQAARKRAAAPSGRAPRLVRRPTRRTSALAPERHRDDAQVDRGPIAQERIRLGRGREPDGQTERHGQAPGQAAKTNPEASRERRARAGRRGGLQDERRIETRRDREHPGCARKQPQGVRGGHRGPSRRVDQAAPPSSWVRPGRPLRAAARARSWSHSSPLRLSATRERVTGAASAGAGADEDWPPDQASVQPRRRVTRTVRKRANRSPTLFG